MDDAIYRMNPTTEKAMPEGPEVRRAADKIEKHYAEKKSKERNLPIHP